MPVIETQDLCSRVESVYWGATSLSDYDPFITDPAHLMEVEGHRYVVLRPHGPVLEAFRRAQDRLREVLPGAGVSYPAFPHVTLGGFPQGTALSDVQDAVEAWAARTPPLALHLEGVDVFPAPDKVLFVRVSKTAELDGALVALGEEANARGLPDVDPRRVEDWIFHMSAAYCDAMVEGEWERATQVGRDLAVPSVSCVVHHVEIVAYDRGRERSGGALPLGGRAT